MALGIAASLASGLQQNFGSMTKPLHAGWAARSGVVAAQLAARGFSADAEALEGPGGFLRAMSGGAEPDLAPFDALGEPFEIVSPGVGVKLYPCCYATHRAIDAVLELRAEHGIAPANVAEVRVEVNRGGLLPLRVEPPATGLEGKFSLEYCLAAALLDGGVGLCVLHRRGRPPLRCARADGDGEGRRRARRPASSRSAATRRCGSSSGTGRSTPCGWTFPAATRRGRSPGRSWRRSSVTARAWRCRPGTWTRALRLIERLDGLDDVSGLTEALSG